MLARSRFYEIANKKTTRIQKRKSIPNGIDAEDKHYEENMAETHRQLRDMHRKGSDVCNSMGDGHGTSAPSNKSTMALSTSSAGHNIVLRTVNTNDEVCCVYQGPCIGAHRCKVGKLIWHVICSSHDEESYGEPVTCDTCSKTYTTALHTRSSIQSELESFQNSSVLNSSVANKRKASKEKHKLTRQSQVNQTSLATPKTSKSEKGTANQEMMYHG